VGLVHIPELELGVCGGGHQVTAVQELHVAHGLTVTLEHVQGLLRRPHKIWVNDFFLSFFSTTIYISPTQIRYVCDMRRAENMSEKDC